MLLVKLLDIDDIYDKKREEKKNFFLILQSLIKKQMSLKEIFMKIYVKIYLKNLGLILLPRSLLMLLKK